MNTRAFTLALIIAGVAMYMVYTYVESQKSSMIKRYGTESSVVVAKVDIKELELIDDSKVTIKTVPQSFLQPGHFKEIKELDNTVATVPILKGEQLTKPRVTYPGAKTGLARQVSVGKRAFALNVTDQQAVGKLIKPGDRVDVLASINYAGGDKERVRVQTILQDVLVLSTGLSVTNSIPMIGIKTPRIIKKMNLNTYQKYSTITLELEPYQAQKIIFLTANLNTVPYLSLRNNNDKKRTNPPPTSIYDVIGKDKGQARQYFEERRKKKK